MVNRFEGPIHWRLHLPVETERVYEAVSTDAGRATFWAETNRRRDGTIRFRFTNGSEHVGRELVARPNEEYALEYFGGIATFQLAGDGAGGTDLLLTHTGQEGMEWLESYAGWLNVLLPLKALLAHGIDLKNGDPHRSWDRGYVDG